ncbi:unnamed protein product [Mytilus edulis]|uniref:Uncharacterized protein n=1 Tax=Mytilus edulis TaxID=6550 RepID=A0A8S3U4M9_MYTED|nr:unnamed protein product [Mytilus edulis]
MLDLCHNDGWSPLNTASDNGHTDIFLYEASANGHTEIVSLLLEKNPNIDLCDNGGCSSLYIAKKNPNIDLCDNNGWRPSRAASEKGHTEIELAIREESLILIFVTTMAHFPLQSKASENGHTEIVSLLLEKNPNIDLVTSMAALPSTEQSPLKSASAKGHTDIVKLLLEKNPNVGRSQLTKDTLI